MTTYSYDIGRNFVGTGDLLIWSGNTLFSKLIKTATNSEFTHVGIAWRSDESGRLIIMESMDGRGIQLAPLSKKLPVLCFKTGLLCDEKKIIDLGMKHWGEKYSWWGCLQAWLSRPVPEDDAWQCAEFASYLLSHSGVYVPDNCKTPARLARFFADKEHFYLEGN